MTAATAVAFMMNDERGSGARRARALSFQAEAGNPVLRLPFALRTGNCEKPGNARCNSFQRQDRRALRSVTNEPLDPKSVASQRHAARMVYSGDVGWSQGVSPMHHGRSGGADGEPVSAAENRCLDLQVRTSS